MSDQPLYIASAVVKTRPANQHAVAAWIEEMAGVEVAAIDHGHIIVVLEADDRCGLATTLNRIADMDGVLSATLVFEHGERDSA